MSAPLRVAVVGAAGRLGRYACELVEREPGFDLVARIGPADALEDTLACARADVALEVTRAGLGFAHGRRLLEAGVRPLIATSGIRPEEAHALDVLARARGLGGLVAPNLSRGMWLLQRAAEAAARHVARCEIVEGHHAGKKDAPSGTALDTARRIAAARGTAESVPIHSLRLPGMAAHQEVVFGSAGEIYTLRHDALSPEAYAPGILAGLAYVARAVGVEVGIGVAFEDAG